MLEFYVLGYWVCPYGRNDNEYFWAGPFDSRKDALDCGKLKQARGQPRQFTDWVKGSNKVFDTVEKFVKAANKAGVYPKL